MPGRDWHRLYQLQDWVLARLAGVAHGFYLSGGTALSRGYSAHRHSEDLADIFWLCCRDGLDLRAALDNAAGKAAGIFPPLVARALAEGLRLGLPNVVSAVPRGAPLAR